MAEKTHNSDAHTVVHPLSFSLHLTRNFIISTMIPVLASIFLIVHFVSERQLNDQLISAQSHLSSVALNIENYLTDLRLVTLIPYYDENFSRYLGQDSESALSYSESASIRRSLGNMVDLIRYTRDDIQSVLIVHDKSCLYYRTDLIDTAPASGYDYAGESWYQEALNAGGSVVFVSPHIPEYYDRGISGPVFSMVKSLNNLRTRIPYAVIKVDANVSHFKKLLDSMSFTIDSTFSLTDDRNAIIHASDSLNSSALINFLSSGPKNGSTILDGRSVYHLTQNIEPYGWTIHVFFDRSEIRYFRYWIIGIALAVYLVCVFFMLISYYMLSRSIVTSMREIRGVLSRLQSGDLSARYSPTRHDELSLIGQSVNEMADQIEMLIEKEYIAVLHQKEAELRALQAQIQPHFFFNVIGSLIALNQLSRQDALEESLFALSRLMRYVLSQQKLVFLSEELSFLNDYIALQKLRYMDKLDSNLSIDASLSDFLIPRLSLQPYIENAVIHGIEPCEHPCIIRMTATPTESGVEILILDDGEALPDTTSNGIGIQNSRERFEQYYPGSTVTLCRGPFGGCEVHIHIQVPQGSIAPPNGEEFVQVPAKEGDMR